MNKKPRVATAMPWTDRVSEPELDEQIADGLDSVETLLWESVKNDQPLLNETSSHLLSAGGKRFRPMLALLSAHFGDPGQVAVTEGATACELIHLATLYHDDVMDEAKLRRGVESANTRWNNSIAILTGDFLFAAAARIISKLGESVVDVHTETTKRLVGGQLRETVGWSPGLTPEEHYLKVISDKTASLFAASCHIGAELAGLDEAGLRCLNDYAEALGMAFQLSDDVLDIVGDETLGKKAGGDLREGVPTLPTIFVRDQNNPGDERMLELLGMDLAANENDLAEALKLLRDHQAITYTRAKLQDYVHKAVIALAPLPDRPARAALEAIAESMISRTT
jgi:heptaprenyl diphosphate synthase